MASLPQEHRTKNSACYTTTEEFSIFHATRAQNNWYSMLQKIFHAERAQNYQFSCYTSTEEFSIFNYTRVQKNQYSVLHNVTKAHRNFYLSVFHATKNFGRFFEEISKQKQRTIDTPWYKSTEESIASISDAWKQGKAEKATFWTWCKFIFQCENSMMYCQQIHASESCSNTNNSSLLEQSSWSEAQHLQVICRGSWVELLP